LLGFCPFLFFEPSIQRPLGVRRLVAASLFLLKKTGVADRAAAGERPVQRRL